MQSPNVLGIGEIGLNKNSKNEILVLEKHIDLAASNDQLILVHTPHLEDKRKGTQLILDILKADSRIKPERCIIDHVEEHTVKMVLDDGFWAGMTLYPETKCTSNRAIDILEVYGNERIWMNSACDWGSSVPLAVPNAIQEMRRRGKDPNYIDKIVYQNPIGFMSQSPRFIEPKS
jgi:predicted metal-dependent TIM-barrel fold hydrolase